MSKMLSNPIIFLILRISGKAQTSYTLEKPKQQIGLNRNHSRHSIIFQIPHKVVVVLVDHPAMVE